jgi:BirA family biotin operon repressor/biotin-[acetyl-CoA-carboxylase] ligase
MPFSQKKMLILDSVDSTNNYAMGLIQKREIQGEMAIFAREQTQGKGRRGKQWQSNMAENIVLSIAVPMQWLEVSRQFQISVAAALACRDLLKNYVFTNLFIKWPNDIFLNDSKAGGILIENVIKGKIWQCSVIGIGININQQIFEDKIVATSLKLITGKNYDVIHLAEILYSTVLKRIEELKTGDFQKMLEEYNEHLYARGKLVKLKKRNAVFETKIVGVSFSGELITEDSLERRFVFDEIEFKGLA